MSENDSGFSFGVAPDADDLPDEIDAIEVGGEPISRSEARNLGLVQFDVSKEAKRSSVVFRRDQLPSGLSEELTGKLEKAWQHLKRNEIDAALTIAQEAVWESPDLAAPKFLIARCFIVRKEYAKALGILQAIPESGANSEILYYLALCMSRLERVKEAIEILKRAKASSGDGVIRKRANDLLLSLQGEQTVCPVCGKKTLYASMVEAGDQIVCASCAKKMPAEEDEEEDFAEDEDETDGKRRKKLRPPLTKMDVLVRVLFCLFLAGFLLLGLYIMSFISPAHYMMIRRHLPESWTFLPNTGNVTPVSEILEAAALQKAQPLPTVKFDSPALAKAVAGVEIRHTVFVRNMEKRDGVYRVSFQPVPVGKYSFHEKTGDLAWTPANEDAGKIFTVTFGAAFNNVVAQDQANKVAVSSGPRFRNVYALDEPQPGQALHLLADDLGGDEQPEIIAVSGMYWGGQIAAFSETGDGGLQPLAKTDISGRPAGAGVVMADGEKWLAVADYWNSRLRHYALRDGNISEMAVDVELPGRPLLAGFDRDSSLSAIVCRGQNQISLACFRQEGQLRNSLVGEWPLPDEFIWRRLLILPGNEAEKRRPLPVLVGGDPAESIFLVDLEKNALVPVRLNVQGEIVDAVIGAGNRILCLVRAGDTLRLVGFGCSLDGTAINVDTQEAGAVPIASGLASAALIAGEGRRDNIVFSPQRLGISFAGDDGRLGGFTWWDLPRPSRLFGSPASAPGNGGHSARVFYADAENALWQMDIVSPEVGK